MDQFQENPRTEGRKDPQSQDHSGYGRRLIITCSFDVLRLNTWDNNRDD